MTEGNANLPAESKDSPAATASALEAKRQSRRRLIKAALLAAPLMITLRGKPAHAQLSSLGSAEIPYGPMLYVTEADINKDANDNITTGDLGKAIKPLDNGKFEILDDKTRRDQTGTGQEIER